MVKELTSTERLWKKITVEKLEDRKEYSVSWTVDGCTNGSFCWLFGFGGQGDYTIHIGGVPSWTPC